MRSEPFRIPTNAERTFKALQRLNRRLGIALGKPDHLRAPIWSLQLPGGEEFKISHITYDGTVMIFTGFHATSENADYVVSAPEAVVITVKSVELKTFVGNLAPIEFEPADDEDEPDDE